MHSRNRWLSFAFGALALSAQKIDAQQGGTLSQAVPRSPTQVAPQGQLPESCIAGRVFGITEYKCTSCGMASPRDSTHVVYSFGTEPVVVETADQTNRIKPGDYVVAVNGNPITTRVGADHFAYPPVGTATLTVRRNNVNINIEQLVPTTRYCPLRPITFSIPYDSMQRAGAVMAPARGGGGGGGRGGARVGGGAGGGSGVFVRADGTIDTMALRLQRSADSARARGGIARGVQILRAAPVELIRGTVELRTFGLMLTCHPTCTQARTRDGATIYWRFDAFPTIANPVPASPAGKAGLRDGDEIILVNDVSPLVEEGALLLNRSDGEPTLRLEIRRAGKVEKITLKR